MDVAPPEVATLTCWKDIANYLGKGVRTVQRWEQEFGLPVRRPNGISHKSPVSADPRDLDAWMKSRWSVRAEKTEDGEGDGGRKNPSVLVREALVREMRDNVHQWNELQGRLKRARHEHHELVRELTEIIKSLNDNCRLLGSASKPFDS